MKTAKRLTRVAVIAALYAALTLTLPVLSYGPVQCRLSEALTVLPLFCVEAVPGLTIGCFLANLASTPWDLLFGTLATLLAAVCTYFLKKIYLGVIPPVLFNMLLVPIVFILNPDPATAAPYYINMFTVGLGQLIAVVLLGVPLYFGLKRVQKRSPELFN